jgi:recombination protein RecT
MTYKKGTSWTFWAKDFDGMAYKTMLRQLISKWGIMSIDMEKAYESDMAVIHDDNSYEYVDNAIEIETPQKEDEPAQEVTTTSNVKEPIEEKVVEEKPEFNF